ncbi:hypothetical protein ACLB2K_033327 [Fragaria x ananassa]
MSSSPNKEGDMHLHWKGPATTILAMCSHYNDNKGETKIMDEQSMLVFNQIIEDMQSKYLKTIAFAYRQTGVPMLEENSLILIALLGVRYSCCTDIVEVCHEAGINIILVSEDNVSDLKDIASECGILRNPNRLVKDGKSCFGHDPQRAERRRKGVSRCHLRGGIYEHKTVDTHGGVSRATIWKILRNRDESRRALKNPMLRCA